MDKNGGGILCTAGSEGKRADFKLLKDSRVRFKKDTWVLGDSGYQGLQHLHDSTLIPHKKPKGGTLTDVQKSYNQQQASERVPVENVIGWLKRFRILAEKYRNRRRRFGLRFNLIAAIYNYELKQKSSY